MPRAFTGTYSPDGRRIAYEDVSVALAAEWAQEQSSQWRHYRGGRTHPIRLIDLADYSVEKLPWTNSNDTSPMWVGDTVYFLSDRNGTTNLFSYDPRTKQVAQLTRHDDFDIMSASAGPDAIVYEQAGYIHLVDTATRKPAARHRGDRRFSLGASAVQEGRQHDSQRRAVADRRARGLRGARRYLHTPRRRRDRRATSRRVPACTIAARCGRPTARRSRGSRTRAASTN